MIETYVIYWSIEGSHCFVQARQLVEAYKKIFPDKLWKLAHPNSDGWVI